MNQSKEILKNTLKNDLLKVLPFEADIDFQEITRSNGEVYESMTVTPKDSQMGVNLRLDSMIDKYSKEPKSMLLSSIKDEIIEAINQMPAFDLASLSDYESIKGQLMVAPLSDLARKNQTDLVTIEKCGVKLYPVIDLGKGRIGIREKHLANYGITKEKLFSDAFANMKEKETMTIRSLSELLGQSSQEGPELFVVSNQENILGAAEAFVPGNIEKIAQEVGGDCFLLLSSTHELLAVSLSELIPRYCTLADAAKAMDQMVTEINAAQVLPEDQIDDFSLFYDATNDILMQSAKYADRLERNVLHQMHRIMDFDARAELIERIDEAENWDDIDTEEYESLCANLGLDYYDYDDPDKLFEDIIEAQAKSDIEKAPQNNEITYRNPARR